MKKTLGAGWIVLLFLVRGAFAQAPQAGSDDNDIRIVSFFVPARERVPEDCSRQAHVFAESLARFPRPASWHWVLVCDEAGWRRFLRWSGRGEEDSIYASTDLAARTTYLRGARLLAYRDFGVGLNDVVAHELAHIGLTSEDELKAEALSRAWSHNPDQLKRGITKVENTGN